MTIKWIIVGVIVALIIFSTVFLLRGNTSKQTTVTPSPTMTQEKTSTVSIEEKRKIDTWIEEENLNEFGDPKESMYAGGTPLFDEASGETKDRYEYILNSHPDRPWEK